jgi:PAS domain S-box-containing protein
MNEKIANEVILAGRLGTWDWYVQTGEATFNERWAEIIGYTLEELQPVSIETWMKFAHPDDLEESNAKLQKCFNKEVEYYDHLARMKHKKGHWVWVQDRGRVIEWNEDGTPKRMVGSHNDLSEEIELRQQLSIALHQKELLLDEVHHRVKNNLLTLRSLAQIKSENGQVPLKELNDAISAISKMHEAVYLTESYEVVTVRWYLERVLREMIMPAHATLHYDIQETNEYWKTENLVPLGIIVSEIISNSCKHAGKNGKEYVNITVNLAEKDNQLVLTIRDDGAGFAEESPEIDASESVGFMLIDMYANKLNGECKCWNENGAVTQCIFPLVLGGTENKT